LHTHRTPLLPFSEIYRLMSRKAMAQDAANGGPAGRGGGPPVGGRSGQTISVNGQGAGANKAGGKAGGKAAGQQGGCC
jgi:hypothetical protein